MSGRSTFSTRLSASVGAIPWKEPSPGRPTPCRVKWARGSSITGQSTASRKHSGSEVQLQKPLNNPRTAKAQREGHGGQRGELRRLMQKWQVLLSFLGQLQQLQGDTPGCRERSRRRAGSRHPVSSRAGSNLRGWRCRKKGRLQGQRLPPARESEQVSELPVFLSLLGDKVEDMETALGHCWSGDGTGR